MNELTQAIERWNKGEISDGELLSTIVAGLELYTIALDDVRSQIYQRETEAGETRMAKLLGER